MRKYVIELAWPMQEPSDAEVERIRAEFEAFLASGQPSCVLAPGMTLKVFDTEFAVNPDVEVWRAPTPS